MNIKKENGVIEQYFATLIELVTDSMPYLVAGTQYTLKNLVGRDEWDLIPKVYRPHLGAMFSAYVKGNNLPLEHNGTNGSNAICYVKR